ncbi:16S rRNA (cytidine(1402)-2'-O)-methyltransferase [Candidatus Giovannonibacteria bacterium RIFCSPHIGHO2_02_42_15]|uniref:Ribosomal RNA small subunit methyltransferase I n=2 Tax=Candidatus Giovannoniibacteriota TaxID=1752738 RepID=A0A1F5VMV6_9BACT|nr:MAG: Ribosomal RNA small subunit methyltransferase I [Candidatus Giovannonibacteria bacterium GW2011_GWF2_42_19]OGF64618.1 MAG: 16S rRNA (cytidine(1402)-2'-O)-methyltransferase [Candidatus Giovannonibacteria bacterium RIFCSPHIGHO2_02_42_15]
MALYVVPTPIGNLKDVSFRALEVLKNVDLILAEDTRVTKKLLSHYGISKPLIRFDEREEYRNSDKVLNLLLEGKNLALVSDAGTPGISDPGAKLVSFLVSKFKSTELQNFETSKLINIIPIPGPSAISTMISASDINLSEFVFLGFPPHKKGRMTFFKKVASSDLPVILFESPHRIEKTLKELFSACKDRRVNVGRELTKIYEEIWRGNLSGAADYFQGQHKKGEFVIVVDIK